MPPDHEPHHPESLLERLLETAEEHLSEGTVRALHAGPRPSGEPRLPRLSPLFWSGGPDGERPAAA
jgi:hypothetical protein